MADKRPILPEIMPGEEPGDAFRNPRLAIPFDPAALDLPPLRPRPGPEIRLPPPVDRSQFLDPVIEDFAVPRQLHGAGELLGEGYLAARRGDYLPAIGNTVLGAAAIPGSRLPMPALSKMAPKPKGRFFNMSRLNEVPADVPQVDLPRYDPNVGKRRGTTARISDLLENENVWSRMNQEIESGLRNRADYWYGTAPLKDAFQNILGGPTGAEAYRKYLEFVAATSHQTPVKENIRNASDPYMRWMNGKPPLDPYRQTPPPGYGSKYQRIHMINSKRVAEEGMDPLVSPKPSSFVENLYGNRQPGTMDVHAWKLPAMLSEDPRFLGTSNETYSGRIYPQDLYNSGKLSMEKAVEDPIYWSQKPNKTEYLDMERYYQQLAKHHDIATADAQAAAWFNDMTGRKSDTRPWLSNFEDVLERTAAKRSVSMSQAINDFIKGKHRLRADGGAVKEDAPPKRVEDISRQIGRTFTDPRYVAHPWTAPTFFGPAAFSTMTQMAQEALRRGMPQRADGGRILDDAAEKAAQREHDKYKALLADPRYNAGPIHNDDWGGIRDAAWEGVKNPFGVTSWVRRLFNGDDTNDRKAIEVRRQADVSDEKRRAYPTISGLTSGATLGALTRGGAGGYAFIRNMTNPRLRMYAHGIPGSAYYNILDPSGLMAIGMGGLMGMKGSDLAASLREREHLPQNAYPSDGFAAGGGIGLAPLSLDQRREKTAAERDRIERERERVEALMPEPDEWQPWRLDAFNALPPGTEGVVGSGRVVNPNNEDYWRAHDGPQHLDPDPRVRPPIYNDMGSRAPLPRLALAAGGRSKK